MSSDPFNVLASGVRGAEAAGDYYSLLYHYRRIWDVASDKHNLPHCNEHTPLWHNTTLSERLSIPNTDMWSAKGVYYVSHFLAEGNLKTFDRLKVDVNPKKSQCRV